MIVGAPPLVARAPPPAYVALRYRLRVGVLAAIAANASLQRSLDQPVVGKEIVEAEALRREVVARRHDVHQLGRQSLDVGDDLRVQAELEDRPTAGFPSQLCVHDLVGVGPEPARTIHASQNIGASKPAPILEGWLHDHVMPGPHRGDGRLEAVVRRVRAHIKDAEPVPTQGVQVLSLVFEAALLQHFEQRVVPDRRDDLSPGGPLVQPRQMLAAEVVGQVTGRKPYLGVQNPHRRSTLIGAGGARERAPRRPPDAAARSPTLTDFHLVY